MYQLEEKIMYINNDIDYLKFLKNKDIVIFGAGERGKYCHIRLGGGYRIIAFCDNDIDKQRQPFCGLPVIPVAELHDMDTGNFMIIICSNYEREIKQQLLDENIFNFISISQIDFGGGEEYYDESYFAWQQKLGKFGGKIKARMFQPHIKENMVVVEFGSGGGYLLENIIAKEKVGIEINDSARAAAKESGIKSVKNIGDLPDDYADIIISTSALEHVENPLGILRELRTKLKENGKIVFHVPNESCDKEYVRNEINNEFYSWNCLLLGNLFKAAGYFVYSVEKIQEVWPKYFMEIEEEVSRELFETICEMGGKAFDENRCIIVAYK